MRTLHQRLLRLQVNFLKEKGFRVIRREVAERFAQRFTARIVARRHHNGKPFSMLILDYDHPKSVAERNSWRTLRRIHRNRCIPLSAEVNNPLLKHRGLSYTPATATGGTRVTYFLHTISRYLCVAAQTTVVKRRFRMVTLSLKDAPKVSIKFGYCDVEGAIYTRRRGFTRKIFW